MESKVYGYVRVSSKDQNEDRQVLAMRQFGIPDEQIFIEKRSGKDFNRPIYQNLLHTLNPGDVLVIKSIDRLGRNYLESIDQWRMITREKKAAIVVLEVSLLDTRISKDLTGMLISDIVLQLLSYVAETEREFIRSRQKEGIAAAKARGVRFGAKPKKKPTCYKQCVEKWQAGEISARAAAKECGISHKTFLRWVRKDAIDSDHEADDKTS